MRGTARTMPANPHIHPQKERLTRMTKGESPKSCPSQRGSTMFPKTMFMASTTTAMKMIGPHEGANWTMANTVVIAHEMIEPRVGMKFKMNARMPQMTGNSSPTKIESSQTPHPVIREMRNFMERKCVTSWIVFAMTLFTLFLVPVLGSAQSEGKPKRAPESGWSLKLRERMFRRNRH